MMHEVEVAGMGIDSESQAPVLLLKQKNGEDAIPIVIGLFEATSIVMALREDKSERPMTHDLFCDYIEKTGFFIEKIDIYDLKKGVYYANICYKSEKDQPSFFTDARPSDAIALALRFNAPIFIDEKVILKARETFSVETEDDFVNQAEVADKTAEGKKWAEYLKNLNPDDFGKYKV